MKRSGPLGPDEDPRPGRADLALVEQDAHLDAVDRPVRVVVEEDVGALAPGSRVTGMILCAAARPMPRPTSVGPVKASLSTSEVVRYSPERSPEPLMTSSTPAGRRPASSMSRVSSSTDSEAALEGLKTTVLPATSAGASSQAAMRKGGSTARSGRRGPAARAG